MGNNESFPPPPPGQNPPPPPGQPQQPYYPPTQQQPQYQQPVPGQYPTQQMPQQPGYPPQYGQMPPGMPPAAPKKKTGLIVGVGVVVVAAIVGAVVLLGGDDDKKTTSVTTAAPDTTGNNGTIVLTVPGDSTTVPVITGAATTLPDDGDVITVTDDTGSFSVMVPADMGYNSAPFDVNGTTFARVAASYDLQAFFDGDDEYGWLAVVAGPETGFTAQSMLEGLSPTEGCATSTDRPSSATMYGDALVRVLEGCGSSGLSAKAILAVQDPATGKVVGFYAQGGDASTLEALVTVMIYTVTLY